LQFAVTDDFFFFSLFPPSPRPFSHQISICRCPKVSPLPTTPPQPPPLRPDVLPPCFYSGIPHPSPQFPPSAPPSKSVICLPAPLLRDQLPALRTNCWLLRPKTHPLLLYPRLHRACGLPLPSPPRSPRPACRRSSPLRLICTPRTPMSHSPSLSSLVSSFFFRKLVKTPPLFSSPPPTSARPLCSRPLPRDRPPLELSRPAPEGPFVTIRTGLGWLFIARLTTIYLW